MPIRKSPTLTPKRLAANQANAQKSTGPRTDEGKRQAILNLKRNFDRLLGLPESRLLDQQVGTGVHIYKELIAPYEPAPPLLAMVFRDLARLQVELQGLERIRDARMEYRDQQTQLEVNRTRRDMDRELRATAKDIFENGLCRQPDSFGKFNDQCEALLVLKSLLKQGRYDQMHPSLRRLYGKTLWPDHERGQIICASARSLMNPEAGEPLTEDQFKMLTGLVEAEEQDVMDAWDLALKEKTMTEAAGRSRLAPDRTDQWMNQQSDRLRLAIDRKTKLAAMLIKTLELTPAPRPDPAEQDQKNLKSQSQNVTLNQEDTETGGLGQSRNVI